MNSTASSTGGGQRSRVGSSSSQRSRSGTANSDISDEDSIASTRSNRSTTSSKASLQAKGKQEWGKLKNAVRGTGRRKRGSKNEDIDEMPDPVREDPDVLAMKLKQQVFEEDLPYIHRLIASDIGE